MLHIKGTRTHIVVYILVYTYIVVYMLLYTYRAVGRVVAEGCGEDKIREADAPAFLRERRVSTHT